MNRAVRTSLRLVVSIMLLSAAALAHVSGNTVDKNKSREHPSRFSKIAFWRHHKDGDSVKTAEANHAPVKNAQAKPAQTKPAARTLAAGKKGQKQERSGGRAPAKTTSTVTKPKPQPAAQDRTTASLKQ